MWAVFDQKEISYVIKIQSQIRNRGNLKPFEPSQYWIIRTGLLGDDIGIFIVEVNLFCLRQVPTTLFV